MARQSRLLSIKGHPIPLNEIPSFIALAGLLILAAASIALLQTGYVVFAAICFIMFIIPGTAYVPASIVSARMTSASA